MLIRVPVYHYNIHLLFLLLRLFQKIILLHPCPPPTPSTINTVFLSKLLNAEELSFVINYSFDHVDLFFVINYSFGHVELSFVINYSFDHVDLFFVINYSFGHVELSFVINYSFDHVDLSLVINYSFDHNRFILCH